MQSPRSVELSESRTRTTCIMQTKSIRGFYYQQNRPANSTLFLLGHLPRKVAPGFVVSLSNQVSWSELRESSLTSFLSGFENYQFISSLRLKNSRTKASYLSNSRTLRSADNQIQALCCSFARKVASNLTILSSCSASGSHKRD